MSNVRMPDLGQLMQKSLERTETEVLAGIEREAKISAPVDTGYYRNEIQADYLGKEVVAKARYSAALEYGVTGTRRVPRPIMRNAARKMAQQVGAIFKRNFK